MKGCQALTLIKDCVKEREWKDLDKEEQDWLVKQLVDNKKEGRTVKKIIHAAKDIEGTVSRIDPEVDG